MRGCFHEPCGAGLRPSPREFLAPHVLAGVLVFVRRLHFDSAIAAGSYPLSVLLSHVV